MKAIVIVFVMIFSIPVLAHNFDMFLQEAVSCTSDTPIDGVQPGDVLFCVNGEVAFLRHESHYGVFYCAFENLPEGFPVDFTIAPNCAMISWDRLHSEGELKYIQNVTYFYTEEMYLEKIITLDVNGRIDRAYISDCSPITYVCDHFDVLYSSNFMPEEIYGVSGLETR